MTVQYCPGHRVGILHVRARVWAPLHQGAGSLTRSLSPEPHDSFMPFWSRSKGSPASSSSPYHPAEHHQRSVSSKSMQPCCCGTSGPGSAIQGPFLYCLRLAKQYLQFRASVRCTRNAVRSISHRLQVPSPTTPPAISCSFPGDSVDAHRQCQLAQQRRGSSFPLSRQFEQSVAGPEGARFEERGPERKARSQRSVQGSSHRTCTRDFEDNAEEETFHQNSRSAYLSAILWCRLQSPIQHAVTLFATRPASSRSKERIGLHP